jgi:pyruvate kinase
LNLLHGSQEQNAQKVQSIYHAASLSGRDIEILIDINRLVITDNFNENDVHLSQGNQSGISMKRINKVTPMISKKFSHLVNKISGEDPFFNDESTRSLIVNEKSGNLYIFSNALNALSYRKDMKNPKTNGFPFVFSEKGRQDIIFGIKQQVDCISIVCVNARTILDIKAFLENYGASHIKVIAKIENQEGINNSLDILVAADGLLISGGDIQEEMPIEEVHSIQKKLIKLCNSLGKPVINCYTDSRFFT